MPEPLHSQLFDQGNWTDVEKWVWQKASNGEIADFNEKFNDQPELKPDTAEDWTAARLISNSFLESILVGPYKNSLPRRGLRIVGAWFTQKIDLSNARLITELWLDKCRFEQSVNFYSMRTDDFISIVKSFFVADLNLNYFIADGTLNLKGIKVRGDLSMSYLTIAKNLFLNDGAECANVHLQTSRIGGDLNLQGVKISGTIDMSGIYISGDLQMQDSPEHSNILLVGAKVDGQVIFSRSAAKDTVDMDGIVIGSDLFIRQSTFSEDLNLTGAKIGGQVVLNSSIIHGQLDLDGISVGSDVMIREGAELTGIDLTSAQIKGQLDLSKIKISGELDASGLIVDSDLLLTDSNLYKELTLSGAIIGGDLILEDSKVEGNLNMNNLEMKGRLTMRGITTMKDINLRTTQVQGPASFYKCDIGNSLILERFSTSISLFIQQTNTVNVDIRNARIGDQLEIAGSKLTGPLSMNYLNVKNQFKLINSSEFSDVLMIGGTVGGQCDLINIKVNGSFDMQSVAIDGNFYIRNNYFGNKFSLIDSDIERSVMISGNTLIYVDLGGSSVKAELQIGEKGMGNDWKKDAFLNLRNAKTNILSDGGPDSWPKNLNLDGFTYSGLGQGARGEGDENNIALRKYPWFKKWLAREVPFSAQPYFQLASLLDRLGHGEMANSILYASKERERKKAWEKKLLPKWFGFSLLNITIGYGYGGRYFRSLIWVLGFVLIGIYVVGTVDYGAMYRASLLDRIGFSVDKLIPVIELNDKYKLDFDGWQLGYFYVHKIIGFLLTSFVIAGFSGITKKSSPAD